MACATPELLAALRAATRMQAEEQLAAGPTYERSGYVVVDPLGRRYHPDTVSDYWAAADLRLRSSSPVRESKAVLGPVFRAHMGRSPDFRRPA